MIQSTAGSTSAVDDASISPRTASQTRVSGWFSANPCSHSGIASRPREDRAREDEREQRDEARRRRCLGILHDQREAREHPRHREPEAEHEQHAGCDVERAALRAESDQEPDQQHHRDDHDGPGQVGDRAPAEERGACHRQRAEPVDHAALQVVRQPDRGRRRAERRGLHEDARHEVVDVLEARRRDRAAEHEGEQQHEHDRLDRREHDQLRRAPDAQDVAPGDDGRVARNTAHAVHSFRVLHGIRHRTQGLPLRSSRCVLARPPPPRRVP